MGTNQSSKAKENDINFDPVTKGYFKDLQLIFIHNYIENDNLISNMKVCLDEKNFDQILEDSELANEQNQTIYEPVEFINWLDFLYSYLEEEKAKHRYWAGKMLDKLDEEYFLSENKYLSQFFFEEYGIQTMPDCLNKKRKSTRKININTSILNVTQNLGGSFGESFNQFESEDDAGYKYKEIRNKVKRYIKNFKEHILNKDHPINIVAQIFESVWVDFAKSKIELMKKNYPITNDENKKDIEKDIAEITYQFQKFVIKLQICLKLFYSRTINYSFFNEEKDELINLITTLIFRTGRIYEIMFSLYEFSLRNEIEDMTIKYQRLKKITPEELGVEKKFCLNKETLDLQEQILLKKLNENEKNNKKENKDNKESNEKLDLEKGTLLIDLNKNKNIEITNMNTLIQVIREKKNRIPRPGDRDMEDMKVKLDFDDNSDSGNTLALYANKNDSVYVESNNNYIGSILPKLEGNDFLAPSANVSVDNATIHTKALALNINDSGDELINNNMINLNNIKNNNIKGNDYLFNKKVILDNQPDEANDNVFIVRDSNAAGKNVMPFVPEKILGRVSFMRPNNDDFISYPYETAIQLLKQIKKYKTPFEKMMIIASISNEITDCINDFWTEMENYIKKDFLGIEAEQIMTIFIYIIIKSGITDIFVHCKMIKYFTTCTTKSSMIGYYYSTIEASITYIKTLKNVDELFKNKGKNKIFGTDVN